MVSISCATKAPLPPKVDLLQPIINVQVCENGECKILNVCKRWRIDDKKEWVLVGNEDLKGSCNGIFGVTVDDFTKMRDYSRKLESWIGNNCGSKDNGQP